MIKPLLTLVALSCLPMAAATVSYTSNCDSYRTPSHTNTDSCSAGMGTAFYAFDNVTSVHSNVSLSLGITSTLTVAQTLKAYEDSQDQTGFHLYGISTRSSGTLNYAETLTTSGPMRGGYLHIVANTDFFGGAAEESGATVYVNIGNNLPGYPSTMVTCQAAFGSSNGCYPGLGYFTNLYPFIPITLGTPFTLTATASASANADMRDGSVDYTAPYSFQLFEADFKTQVIPVATPEPATFGLMLLALVALWATRFRSSNG